MPKTGTINPCDRVRAMHDPFARVLTVDGPSGSGKTSLLRGLALRYGCLTIEFGVAVRALAWWMERRGATVDDAVCALAGDGGLRLRPALGSPLAASCALVGPGAGVTTDMFAARLAPAVRAASVSPEAMAWIHGLVRDELRDRPAVLSGREAGTRTCPEAGLKIRLEADSAVRMERKLRQVRALGLTPAWIDETLAIPPAGSVVIDTSRLDEEEVLQTVSRLAERHLRWRRALPAPAPAAAPRRASARSGGR